MFKIAILGCENSHAKIFLQQLVDKRHEDVTVVGVYSDEADTMKDLNEKFGVYMMKSYDELVGQVDGIMITARDGNNHYKYAKPYIPSGIPMFIDKPVACCSKEALEFMREAKKYGVRLCGGSCARYFSGVAEMAEKLKNGEFGDVISGHVAAPIDIPSEYGGFYFYAQHLVQIMIRIFGGDVDEVCANMRDLNASFLAKYENYDVVGNFISDGHYYSGGVFGTEAKHEWQDFGFVYDAFLREFDDMYDLLIGKPMEESYDAFIRPVFIMNAIDRSAKSGKWEKVNAIPV